MEMRLQNDTEMTPHECETLVCTVMTLVEMMFHLKAMMMTRARMVPCMNL